jgi:hypothetical protein
VPPQAHSSLSVDGYKYSNHSTELASYSTGYPARSCYRSCDRWSDRPLLLLEGYATRSISICVHVSHLHDIPPT